MEIEKLVSILESLLFVSGEPLSVSRMAKVSGASKAEVESAVMALSNKYAQGGGLTLFQKNDSIELASNPENASFVSELVKSEIQEKLSPSSLEILSIIAYRGPVTRSEIEAIRGVNSSFSLRTLLMRGLIEREENPRDGRGYQYQISLEFLKRLGVEKIENLPDWEILSKDERMNSIIGEQAVGQGVEKRDIQKEIDPEEIKKTT